jgi:cobalt-zinc-cadmium efflux system membrane fusion protein
MSLFRFCPPGLFRNARVAALCCVAGVFVSLSTPFAHEGGHEDDDATRSALSSSTYPRVTAHSELYELVGIVRGERLSIYLDHFDTNEPVADAKVKVAIGDAGPVDAEPTENGVYTISFPRLARSGSVEVVFNVTAASGDDLLVGALTLPSDTEPSAAHSSIRSLSLWIGSIPWPIGHPIVLIVIAFGLGVLFGHFQRGGRLGPAMATGVAAVGVLLVLVVGALSGGDHDDFGSGARTTGAGMSDAPRRLPDGTAFVAKPTQRLLEVRTTATKPETVRPAVNLIGRVIGDPNRTSVVQSVHGGRVIPLEGRIPAIGQSVRKGDVLVLVDPYLPLADRTTIIEKIGEIEQQIAVAEAKLRRFRPLAETNAVPKGLVTDTETELAGLRRRREAMSTTRSEPELLRAPTDGVIAAINAVPGKVVQPQDMLFQVVDPNAFWVEALVYGAVDAASLAEATAVGTSGQTMPLAFQGFSRTLQHQASLVHFAVSDVPPALSVGQRVTVVAKSGAPITGIVVPREAVVRSGNGEAIVWLHVEPERFEPRPVRTQPFDGTRVLVAAGVTEGDRVVTRGADLINQIR